MFARLHDKAKHVLYDSIQMEQCFFIVQNAILYDSWFVVMVLIIITWIVCCKNVSLKIFVLVIPKAGLAGQAPQILLLVWHRFYSIICEGCRLQIYSRYHAKRRIICLLIWYQKRYLKKPFFITRLTLWKVDVVQSLRETKMKSTPKIFLSFLALLFHCQTQKTSRKPLSLFLDFILKQFGLFHPSISKLDRHTDNECEQNTG